MIREEDAVSVEPVLEPGLRRRAVEILDQLEMWGQKLGLDRIRATLAGLDHPERDFPVVLVAGTNGKGSTAALLASILSHAGYRSGLFTSPHLESVRERIRVDGRSISGPDLSNALEAVADASRAASEVLPTYFEAMTAAALVHFRRRKVDCAVLEVGLGGRLDATNATEPCLGIVCSIAHDHQEHLGSTLEQIASEKLGIGRPGVPLLIWAKGQRGPQAAIRAARRRGIPVEEVWRQAHIEDADGRLRVQTGGTPPPPSENPPSESPPPEDRPATGDYLLNPGLLGEHQRINVALAVRAAEVLRHRLNLSHLNNEAIERGVAACRWPGRLEEFVVRVNGNKVPVLVDGAHNPAGARALRAHLDRTPSHRNSKARALLFGTVRGKRPTGTLAMLSEPVQAIWLAAPDSHRAVPGGELARRIHRHRPKLEAKLRGSNDLDEALDEALSWCIRHRAELVVCGSLYLVGDVRRRLFERYGAPPPAADIALFGDTA